MLKRWFICMLAISLINQQYLFSQSIDQLEALKKAIENASTVSDFMSDRNGDNIAKNLCTLLTGNPFCDLLEIERLNKNEKEEIQDIKSKFEFENFLSKKGIEPHDFYNKLWEQRKSLTLEVKLGIKKADKAFLDKGNFIRSELKAGNSCNGKNDKIAKVTNTSDEKLEVKLAVKGLNGIWNEELITLKSGASYSTFFCECTDNMRVYVRPNGSNLPFPNKSEYEDLKYEAR